MRGKKDSRIVSLDARAGCIACTHDAADDAPLSTRAGRPCGTYTTVQRQTARTAQELVSDLSRKSASSFVVGNFNATLRDGFPLWTRCGKCWKYAVNQLRRVAADKREILVQENMHRTNSGLEQEAFTLLEPKACIFAAVNSNDHRYSCSSLTRQSPHAAPPVCFPGVLL